MLASLQEGISHELPPKFIDGLRFFGRERPQVVSYPIQP